MISDWEGLRMKIRLTLCAAGLLAGMGVAHADALDPIAVRQTAMALTGGDFAFLRAVVASKGDVKPLAAPAKAIARWAAMIPAAFPAGTDKGGNTKALPEVWSDRAGFEKRAREMDKAATRVALAAKAGDAEAVAAETKLLGEQCSGCHKTYRAK
jgi:cytochrome c556